VTAPGRRSETPAEIQAELAQLEKALTACADYGVRKVIEAWIARLKQRLAEKKSA
jgi:hypothetical protein